MSWKEVFWWLFWAIEWLAYGLLACVSFALGVIVPGEPKRIFAQEWVVWCQSHPTEIGFVLLGVVLIARVMKWMLREESPERQTLDRLATRALNEFRVKVFPGIPVNVEEHLNRVTLFKKVNWASAFMSPRRGCWIWPWGFRLPCAGWLAVTHRSGHVTKNSRAVFLAPNDGRAEGIAGWAYQAGAVRARGLPDLNAEVYVPYRWALWLQFRHAIGWRDAKTADYARLKALVHSYARLTRTSARMVWGRMASGKVCPTSILGVKIYTITGEVWGVVVMDSANAHECLDTNEQTFKTAWTILKKSLWQLGVVD